MKAILYYVLFVIAQFVAAICATAYTNWDILGDKHFISKLKLDAVSQGVSLLIFEGLLCLALWLFLFYRKKQKEVSNASQLKGSGQGKRISLSILTTLLLSVGLSFILSPLNLQDGSSTELFQQMSHSVLCLLLLCVVGPLCEELIFRAAIIPALMKSGVGGLWASFIGALAFALIHGNLAQGIPALIIGFFFGLLYLRSHDLALCLPAHVANNTLGVILLFFPALESGTESLPAAASLLIGAALIGLGLLSSRKIFR